MHFIFSHAYPNGFEHCFVIAPFGKIASRDPKKAYHIFNFAYFYLYNNCYFVTMLMLTHPVNFELSIMWEETET